LLGFPIFGRRWRGSLLAVGSVVLLALLLAPDASIAIGFAFALLLLAALAIMVAGRSSTLGSAAPQSATPSR
jgi:hypothetical protein